jgi:3',5'-cyclic AMP phosphodiesterase CpdA
MSRLLPLVLAALLCSAAPALAASTTTVQRTIQDCDGDNLLEPAPGEPHTDGTSGGGGGEGCDPDREGSEPLQFPRTASLLNFLQLTDFQIVDEESPARVEFLDPSQRIPGLNPFSAAYRPQESLTTQITEASVRQARDATSPVTGAPLDFTLLTGDNADSQQHNETRWFIDILDGTTTGANPDPEMDTAPGDDRKVDPNSGVPTAMCEATPGSVYDGVRDGGRTTPVPDDGYYEPDSSSEPREDGDGYSPVRTDNEAEVGRDVTVRDFPGLFERANERFEAVGLGMPWYSAFGNHDALVQGNSPEAYFGPGGAFTPLPGAPIEAFNPTFHAIATGCVKVQQPTAAQRAAIAALEQQIAGGLGPEALADAQGAIQRIAFEALAQARRDPAAFVAAGGSVDVVPPDARRCHLAKDDPAVAGPDSPCASTGSWIRQHFRTSGTPLGHGFAPSVAADCARYGPQEHACREAAARNAEDPEAELGRPPTAVANHDGYYSFSPKPGFRFVALDSVTDECGGEFCSDGSIDEPQFRWLERQLQLASSRDEKVIAFAHHTLRTTRQPTTDLSEAPVHYGRRSDRDVPPDPQNPTSAETLEELFCRSPALIGYVTGHEHENFVEHYACEEGEAGDFHEISTAAHIDFPQQARMIEIVDTGGGQLEFVLTIIDHAGPANPGAASDGFESGAAAEEPIRLAGIGREIAYNDYQGSRGARGGRDDRNVILPIKQR